jgi:hypothetical protein
MRQGKLTLSQVKTNLLFGRENDIKVSCNTAHILIDERRQAVLTPRIAKTEFLEVGAQPRRAAPPSWLSNLDRDLLYIILGEGRNGALL